MSKWQNIVKRDRDDFRTTGKAVYQRRLDSIKEGKSPFEDLEGLLGDYETGELYKFEKEIMKDMAELKNKFTQSLVERLAGIGERLRDAKPDYDSEDSMMRERERQGGDGGFSDAY